MSLCKLIGVDLYPWGDNSLHAREVFLKYLTQFTEELMCVSSELDLPKIYNEWNRESNYDHFAVRESVDLVLQVSSPTNRGRNDFKAVMSYYKSNMPNELKANDYYNIMTLVQKIYNIHKLK